MKPVLFVTFFTLGIALMVVSGYVPQTATARSHVSDPETPSFDPITRISRPVAAPQYPPAPAPADQPSPLANVSASEKLDAPPDDRYSPDEPRPGPRKPAGDGARSDAEPAEWPALEAPPEEHRRPRPRGERADVGEPELAAEEPGSPPASPALEPPVADAGADRLIWSGWDEIPLDASASTGTGLTFLWRQTAGPLNTTIMSESAAATSATGLQQGERPSWRSARYTFELTVTDAVGQQATDTVSYTVLAAPALRIKPVPERRFELRDGLQFAVFAAWTTNLETFETRFEIVSDTELTFTRIAGGAFEVSSARDGRRWVHHVILTPQDDEPVSWVEYLVDTDEKVPAIVQLGVNWEERAVGE